MDEVTGTELKGGYHSQELGGVAQKEPGHHQQDGESLTEMDIR